MQSPDTKTERVQLTLPCSLVKQCRAIAEQSGLTLSKVLEHFARTGAQQGLTLTFSPSSMSVSSGIADSVGKNSAPNQRAGTQQHGSKETASQNPPAGGDELTLDDVFEPAPARPPKPLGQMTDDELDALDDATDAAVPLNQ